MNPVIALIIANIIWGAAVPIFKYALTNVPPFTFLFIRFFIAALFFCPFIFRLRFAIISKADWFRIIIGSVFGFTIQIGLLFLALPKTESINAPVITSSAPLFLFLFSVMYLHEKPKLKVFVGMLVALIGVLLITFSPLLFGHNHKMDFGETAGNLLYVCSTLGLVVSSLMLKQVLFKVSPYIVTFFSFFIAAVTFLPLAMMELHQWNFSHLNLAGWTGILYGTFFSSIIAYICFYIGLAKIKAEEVGIFTYIEPLVTICVAMPLLHEYPDIYFFIGSLFVFGGIYISERRLRYHVIH